MSTRPPEVTTADPPSTNSTTELFRAAIGPINTEYYLSKFAYFQTADHANANWNWAAALSTLCWLAFRQLWLAALAYAGAVVGAIWLVSGIGKAVFQFSEGVEHRLLMGFAIAAFALPGLYGNAMLYAAYRKKIAAALAHNATVPEACTMLAKRAPTRLRALLLGLASAALVGAEVAAHFDFPYFDTLPYDLPKTADSRPDAAPVAAPAVAPPSLLGVPDTPGATTVTSTADTSMADTTPSSSAVADAPNEESLASTATAGTSASAASPTPAVATPVPSASTTPIAVATPTPMPAPPPALTPAAHQAINLIAAAVVPTESAKPTDSKTTGAKKSFSEVKSTSAKAAASSKASAQPQASFYVNVGLFADSNNALNAYVKLTDAGLPALKQEFNTSKGKRTRVRIGPFDTKGGAQTAIKEVHAMGLEAIILQPEKP
jgi:cell division protein FtsN